MANKADSDEETAFGRERPAGTPSPYLDSSALGEPDYIAPTMFPVLASTGLLKLGQNFLTLGLNGLDCSPPSRNFPEIVMRVLGYSCIFMVRLIHSPPLARSAPPC